ncbi:zinc-binding dehydrogenase [Kutzneria buriramensis]|uniref:NADPH2:quinone reductase n=1 Tax=Kutzneria buriramensis TaxID=1045776 RepID=A0A3E0GYU5_9PSEU|nr:zinc-binding dehydrogenase [Kutzneria buriramensis]REH32566.1 NADPH2:quinone reductase [Kutzneria buriramensis]
MLTMPIDSYGAPDVLRPVRVPVPEPAAGQVRIAAEAISVGFAQTQIRRDIFPAPVWRPKLPVVLGGDVVGVVAALGPDVTGVGVGDRVGAFLLEGAYADHVVAEAATLIPVPAELDAGAATVLAGSGPIAVGVLSEGRLAAGETVLVHAAAGGIGHLAVQLAKLAGAGLVVATASTPAKLEFARSLGADVVVDYTKPDWADEVRAATDGRGVDLVLDSVGGDVLRQGIQLLAPSGRLVFFGSAGGGREIPSVSVMDLIGLKHVTGFALNTWRRAHPDAFRDGVAELTEHLRAGRVVSAVHARLPLSDAARGHEMVEGRQHHGTVVLVPSV